MSLYEDEPMESSKDSGNTSKGNWSDSLKMLQGSIHAKKFHQQQLMKKDSLKGFIPPSADLRRKRAPALPRNPNSEVSFNSITGKMEFRESSCPQVDLSGPPPSVTALIQNITSNMSVFGYNDEYDPLRPNDYNKIKEQRKRETERERHQEEPPKGLYDVDDEDDVDDNQISTKESNERSVNKKGNAFAPPPSLIEEDKRASNINNNETNDFLPPPPPISQAIDRSDDMETESYSMNPGFGSTKGASAVAKMMAKMGYREGQGLGKSQQGMSSALVVEKTSKRGGKILHEKDLSGKDAVLFPPPLLPPPPPSMPPPGVATTQSSSSVKAESGVDLAGELKNATKVVLLKNMVGPGEVDDLLDSETKEECQKYGEVEKCLIFEIPDAAEDEAVRIFVEFKRVESAIRAVIAMNGRYFGGRVVRAKFYDLEKFRRFDLADDAL